MKKSIELKTKHIKWNANYGFTASVHINEVLKRIHEEYREVGSYCNELQLLAEKNNIHDISITPCVVNWEKDKPDFNCVQADVVNVMKDLTRAFEINPVYLQLENPVNYNYSYWFNPEKHRIEVFFRDYYNNDEIDTVIPLSLEETTICNLLVSLNNAIKEQS